MLTVLTFFFLSTTGILMWYYFRLSKSYKAEQENYRHFLSTCPYPFCLYQDQKILFWSSSFKEYFRNNLSFEELLKILSIDKKNFLKSQELEFSYQSKMFKMICVPSTVAQKTVSILFFLPVFPYEMLDVFWTCLKFCDTGIFVKDINDKLIFCNSSYAYFLESDPSHVIKYNLVIGKNANPINAHGKRFFLDYTEKTYKNGSVGFVRDISSFVGMERQYIHLQKHNQALLNHLSIGICIFDAHETIIFTNVSLLKLFALKQNLLKEKVTLSYFFDLLRKYRKIPDFTNFQEYKREKQKLFKQELDVIQEIWSLSDGRTIVLSITQNLDGGLIFFFEDISEKMMLQQGYQTLMAVQKETIDHLSEGIIVVGPDYKIRLSNDAMTKLFGTSFSQNFESIKNCLGCEIFERIEHYIGTQNLEVMQFFFEKKCIEMSYTLLPDGSHLLCFEDVSHRFLMQQNMMRRNSLLEKTDRLKKEFISHVSYEIKSPINTILEYVDLLNNSFINLNEKQTNYLKAIHDSTQYLFYLIQDMIELMQIETKDFSIQSGVVNIELLVRSLVYLLQNRESKILSKFCLEFGYLSTKNVYCNEICIKHALFNLIQHSLRFCNQNEPIVLKIYEQNNEIFFAMKVSQEHIPLDAIDLILKNESVDLIKSHTALNLSIVKYLFSFHEGRVFLDENAYIVCAMPIKNKEHMLIE